MSDDPHAAEPLTLVLEGHLTADQLDTKLGALAPRLAKLQREAPGRLLVDCRTMKGYDAEARARFVQWNAQHREVVDRVAIVTANKLWHMVIATMSLASRQSMKAFVEPEPARGWLGDA